MSWLENGNYTSLDIRVYGRLYKNVVAWVHEGMERLQDPMCCCKDRWRKIRMHTLYSRSCDPDPIAIRQPSPFGRPWTKVCRPSNQERSGSYPLMAPYCKPSASLVPERSILVSFDASELSWGGERTVTWKLVIGNVSGFGLPASNEITPGTLSRAKRLWTIQQKVIGQ